MLYVCAVRVWNSAHSVKCEQRYSNIGKRYKKLFEKKNPTRNQIHPQHASKITNQISDVNKIIGRKETISCHTATSRGNPKCTKKLEEVII